MSKIKNGGLDQYSTEPFEQHEFGTAGIEGVKMLDVKCLRSFDRVCRCYPTRTKPPTSRQFRAEWIVAELRRPKRELSPSRRARTSISVGILNFQSSWVVVGQLVPHTHGRSSV